MERPPPEPPMELVPVPVGVDVVVALPMAVDVGAVVALVVGVVAHPAMSAPQSSMHTTASFNISRRMRGLVSC